MIDRVIQIWQHFYYGFLGRTSDIDLSVIPSSITIVSHYDSKNQVYWVESPDLPDFEATGKSLELLAEHVVDSLLIYLDIPHFFAKRYEGGTLNITDPRTGTQQSIKVARKNLEKVFA